MESEEDFWHYSPWRMKRNEEVEAIFSGGWSILLWTGDP
jgi:hypothetical protein